MKSQAFQDNRTLRKRRAARWSLVSNCTLLFLKVITGVITGSVGVLAEVVNSGADLVGSLVVFLSVRASDEPPDATHAYGHGKIENLAGVATATLVLTGGLYAIWESTWKLVHNGRLEHVGLAMALMAFSAIVNIVVSQHLLTVGRETDSAALIADGRHLRTDVLTSIGVLVGLILTTVTHENGWDSVAALCVSGLILRIGYGVASDAVLTLSDAQLPDNERQVLTDIITRHPEVMGYHKLRTRKSGSYRHVDVHIQVADTHTFVAAHRITEELEDELRQAFPNLHPIIHIEPYEYEERHQREEHGVGNSGG